MSCFYGPLPSPELTNPEHRLLSTGTDSQPADLQGIIYTAKGKAKESELRWISGTARDVGCGPNGVIAC